MEGASGAPSKRANSARALKILVATVFTGALVAAAISS
jgi:hypothetical protein